MSSPFMSLRIRSATLESAAGQPWPSPAVHAGDSPLADRNHPVVLDRKSDRTAQRETSDSPRDSQTGDGASGATGAHGAAPSNPAEFTAIRLPPTQPLRRARPARTAVPARSTTPLPPTLDRPPHPRAKSPPGPAPMSPEPPLDAPALDTIAPQDERRSSLLHAFATPGRRSRTGVLAPACDVLRAPPGVPAPSGETLRRRGCEPSIGANVSADGAGFPGSRSARLRRRPRSPARRRPENRPSSDSHHGLRC